MPTHFAMTVDTEEEWDWDAGWPTGEPSVQNIGKLSRFQELCDRYGVASTYFTNLAVLENDESREILLALARNPRVEVGMHVHPWITPPFQPGPVSARETFLHVHPEATIHAKLSSVYDAFRKHGLEPKSFRGGRYSSGAVVQSFLREKGFLADSSVVPFTSWDDDGAPDYRDRDLAPKRLSSPPGELPLWEIPLTLAYSRRPFRFWHRSYERVSRTWLSKLRLIGLSEKLGIVCRVWLNFEVTPANKMLSFLRLLRSMQLPYDCLTVHSSSLMAGGNPYTPTPADEKRVFEKMELVFSTLAEWDDFEPATPEDAVRAFLLGNLDYLAMGPFIVPHPQLKQSAEERRAKQAVGNT